MVESGNTRIYIDPLQHVGDLFAFVGAPKHPIFPVPLPLDEQIDVLITHIHADHYDQGLLKETFAAKCTIYGPEPVVAAARNVLLRANLVHRFETFYLGGLSITPVPAVDWVGEDQVSYVISDGHHTIFHGGDTNWHGYWWTFAEKFGPFQAAFLPVNGVKGFLPGQQIKSEISGTMDPLQAVTASRILRSQVLVPIHYGLFDSPPGYSEYPQVEAVLDQEAKKQQVVIKFMQDGEYLELNTP